MVQVTTSYRVLFKDAQSDCSYDACRITRRLLQHKTICHGGGDSVWLELCGITVENSMAEIPPFPDGNHISVVERREPVRR